MNNLITILQADPDLAAVTIYDGLPITSDPATQWIAIGHDDSENSTMIVADWVNEYKPVGMRRMDEDGSFKNTLVANDANMESCSIARTAGLTILGAIDTAIRANPSLNGACKYAGLAQQSMKYIENKYGFGVQILFEIKYHART